MSCGCAVRPRRSRVTIDPVVAVAGEQPHALAVALDDQAVAVVLDLVDPFRAVRNLGRAGWNAGFEYRHGAKIVANGTAASNPSMPKNRVQNLTT